jgi:hypothetical protein
MNLVQINERLKDLPMQVVQQYANGMNPEVPPYLALGELQRRELSQKQMATAQGAQQGPQPSVKEQVEQKAGLMQLQQMQQQQMQQQPRGPMPAPAGVPQPEAQPEAIMARGGLAGIPVRRDMFEYAGGGIIAFAKGDLVVGDTMGTPGMEQQELASQAASITDEMVAERRNKAKLIAELEQKLAFLTNAGAPQAAEVRAQLEALKGPEAPRAAPSAPSTARQAPPPQAGAKPDSGLLAAAKAKAAATDVAQPPSAPRPTNTRPAATPPVTPTAQAGAQPNVSPFLAEAATMARDKPVAPTAESVIKDVNSLMPTGLQEASQKKLFADQRARANERKDLFERSRPSGLDDLIRVFGQSGQYKGGTGMAPAYTSNQDRKRAEELAFQKEQNELLTAIEGRSTAADKGVFDARTGAMDKATKAFQDRLITNTKALADLAGVDQRRMDEAAQRLTQMQVAKLQAATAARPSEAERIEAKYMGMIAKGQTKEAEEYLNTISKIKGGGAAGVGAGRNAIMERRQEMKELESMAKNESGQFSDADAKWAASRIAQLARENAKEGGGKNEGVPLPENASAKNLVVGTVYQTAKGPAKWTGTGFMPI